MARRSLRPQLNQIRAWVQQGRTDAWIAHQLEISTSELTEFRTQHGLTGDTTDPTAGADLRDEIEAEIEAAQELDDDDGPEEEAADEADEEEDGSEAEGRPDRGGSGGSATSSGDGESKPRRRRGGRGRRGRRGRKAPALEGTFDHGEKDGYGLWFDPAVQENPTYKQHWAGHRPVTVTIEPERIVITRPGQPKKEE